MRDDAKTFFSMLRAAYQTYGKHYAEDTPILWAGVLKASGIDYKDAVIAITAHMSDPDIGQFLPKPADVIRHVKGTSDKNATRAWGLILDAVDYADSSLIVFDDPKIYGAIRVLGGWRNLRDEIADRLWRSETLSFIRKDFFAAYINSSPRKVTILCAHPSSYRTPIRYIGDRDRAEKLLEAQDEPTPVMKKIIEKFETEGRVVQ